MVVCDSVMELSYRKLFSKYKNFILMNVVSSLIGVLFILLSIEMGKAIIALIGVILIGYSIFMLYKNVNKCKYLRNMISEMHYKRDYSDIASSEY